MYNAARPRGTSAKHKVIIQNKSIEISYEIKSFCVEEQRTKSIKSNSLNRNRHELQYLNKLFRDL